MNFSCTRITFDRLQYCACIWYIMAPASIPRICNTSDAKYIHNMANKIRTNCQYLHVWDKSTKTPSSQATFLHLYPHILEFRSTVNLKKTFNIDVTYKLKHSYNTRILSDTTMLHVLMKSFK